MILIAQLSNRESTNAHTKISKWTHIASGPKSLSAIRFSRTVIKTTSISRATAQNAGTIKLNLFSSLPNLLTSAFFAPAAPMPPAVLAPPNAPISPAAMPVFAILDRFATMLDACTTMVSATIQAIKTPSIMAPARAHHSRSISSSKMPRKPEKSAEAAINNAQRMGNARITKSFALGSSRSMCGWVYFGALHLVSPRSPPALVPLSSTED